MADVILTFLSNDSPLDLLAFAILSIAVGFILRQRWKAGQSLQTNASGCNKPEI